MAVKMAALLDYLRVVDWAMKMASSKVAQLVVEMVYVLAVLMVSVLEKRMAEKRVPFLVALREFCSVDLWETERVALSENGKAAW